MSDVVQFWQEVHQCFDPIKPIGLDRPELHVARDPKYNPITKIEKTLAVSSRERHRYLLTGTIGNGKSSELNSFAGRLAQHRLVVFFDLYGHLEGRVRDPKAIDRLQMWELLGLIGLAIQRAGQDHFGHAWDDEPKALGKALAALREGDAAGGGAEIDVAALAKGMTVAAGGLLGGVLGAGAAATAIAAGTKVVELVAASTEWSWKVGLFDSKPRSDQEGDVQAVLHAVNRMIWSLQAQYARSLLIVFDGLDRIGEADRVKALFVDSKLLGELDCDLLFPLALEHARAHGQQIQHFKLRDLFNVPVLKQDEPSQPGEGIAFFRELVERRFASVRRTLAERGVTCPQDPLPTPQLDRLAYYSGGIPREFVEMIRGVVVEAIIDEREQIDDEVVDRVLREERAHKEFYITKDQIAVLRAVMDDPLHELPGDSLALELIHEKRLLAYPNEKTWFYPHPLLTMVVLRPPPGSAG